MQLTLNHIPEVIETNESLITISDLLKIKSFSYKMLIVKINDTVIQKDNYSTATIKDGDNVQVIHLISGGPRFA